jgi:hypothetical protein
MTAVVIGGSSSCSSASFLRPSLIKLRSVAFGADAALAAAAALGDSEAGDVDGAVGLACEGGNSGGCRPDTTAAGPGAGFLRSDAVAADNGFDDGPPASAASGPLTAAAAAWNGLPREGCCEAVVLMPESDPFERMDAVLPGRAPETIGPLATWPPASAASAAAAAALSSIVLVRSEVTRRTPRRTPTATAV